MTTKRSFYYLESTATPYKRILLGGGRVSLEHVRILRKHGHRAHIVTPKGFRTPFFNKKPQADSDYFLSYKDFESAFQPTKDVVIYPGRHLKNINNLPGKNKILFSQGAFVTISALTLTRQDDNYWQHPDLKGIICVSEGNQTLLEAFQPSCNIVTVPNAVDMPIATQSTKKNLVVFPDLSRPEKNPYDTKTVIQLIKAKGFCDTGQAPIEFLELRNISHEQVLAHLEEAKVLLFLGTTEGLPLQILEALAHGLVVIGFNREPMASLLHRDCLFELNQLEDISKKTIEVLNDQKTYQQLSNWSLQRAADFSRKNQEQALLSALTEQFAYH